MHDVFISYSNKDQQFVHRIVERIKEKSPSLKIWWPPDNLEAGARTEDKIEEEIDQSKRVGNC